MGVKSYPDIQDHCLIAMKKMDNVGESELLEVI